MRDAFNNIHPIKCIAPVVCAFRGYPVSDSDNIRSLNPI